MSGGVFRRRHYARRSFGDQPSHAITETTRTGAFRDAINAISAGRRHLGDRGTLSPPKPPLLTISTIADAHRGRAGGTWQADLVCTVVLRWSPGSPVQILALRDELVGRDFDDPGRWWPDHQDLIGGRDRQAGGTWCASRISTGVTALVLNRPHKRLADPGAPSRGVLPLVAAELEQHWTDQVNLTGMASFLLVLATPGQLTTWDFDGTSLTSRQLEPGTHMVTSGGAEDGKAERYLSTFATSDFPRDWLDVLRRTEPRDDPASLVVRHERNGQVFATVFGEILEARPGRLQLQFTRTPWGAHEWQQLDLS